jgi:hypothetical protein
VQVARLWREDVVLVVRDEIGRGALVRRVGYGVQALAVEGAVRIAVVELGLDAAADFDVVVARDRQVAAVEELV